MPCSTVDYRGTELRSQSCIAQSRVETSTAQSRLESCRAQSRALQRSRELNKTFEGHSGVKHRRSRAVQHSLEARAAQHSRYVYYTVESRIMPVLHSRYSRTESDERSRQPYSTVENCTNRPVQHSQEPYSTVETCTALSRSYSCYYSTAIEAEQHSRDL